jgi:Secretion system C-terminal sorting domain
MVIESMECGQSPQHTSPNDRVVGEQYLGELDDATSSHWWGFHLNTAVLGNQGSTVFSNDNRFGAINGGAGSGHTMVTGTTACNSKIFTRSSILPFKPLTNAGLSTVFYSLTTCPGSALPLIVSPPALTTCTPIPPAPVAPSGSPSANSIAMMNDIANSQIDYGVDTPNNKWLAQYNLYHTLANDTPSRNSSVILTNFYTTTAPTNIKNLVAIEDLLTQGNTIAANALLSPLVPTNVPETNYKNFYVSYIAYLNNTISNNDMETFKNLAISCPLQNGQVVFNARVMYNMLNPTQFTMYANNCAGTSNKKDEEETQIIKNDASNFSVYPNPSAGGFYINSNKAIKQDLMIELFDMTGKKVFEQECVYNGQACYFYANVSAGIYLVKVTNTINNETSLHKLHFEK